MVLALRIRPHLTVVLAASGLFCALRAGPAGAQERRVPNVGELRRAYALWGQSGAPAVVNV